VVSHRRDEFTGMREGPEGDCSSERAGGGSAFELLALRSGLPRRLTAWSLARDSQRSSLESSSSSRLPAFPPDPGASDAGVASQTVAPSIMPMASPPSDGGFTVWPADGGAPSSHNPYVIPIPTPSGEAPEGQLDPALAPCPIDGGADK
jgi:hypothetical protein